MTLRQYIALATLMLALGTAQAQQLEPRAYSPSPIGVNIIGMATAFQSGSVLTDPSLPFDNVSAHVDSAATYYGRTFDLFGRLASITAAVPYAWVSAQGDLQEVSRSVHRSGFVDPQLRFAANLLGGPALTPREFRLQKPQTTLGVSLTVIAPFGQYDASKLVNIGTNRWAFRPELGISHPVGNWALELYAGVWLFGSNDNFYGGQVRKQDALATIQTHVVYTFRPGLWAAADFTYYTGGSTTVGGISKDDRQDNTRGGLTLSVPLVQGQSLKFSWAEGVSTRIGSSFRTLGLAWQMVWL